VKPAGRDLKAEIAFRGFQPSLLDMYTSFARQAAQSMYITTSKVHFIDDKPKDASFVVSQRWTVNRSPFVHGHHQDQFDVRTYSRHMDLYDVDRETVLRWLHYVSVNLPAGVGVDYVLHDYERPGQWQQGEGTTKEQTQGIQGKAARSE
jgi:small subunit ribosomal protein S10